MIGRAIDRYTVVEKLGSGGMGEVYKGRHPSLDQYRAIKVLPPYLSEHPDLVERFIREARHCASLHHPHIVRLEHVDEQDGFYYMVMDYVEGASLKELIDDHGALPLTRSLRIALQVCQALAHAHSRGLVHRDVKSSNILVTRDDYALLTDFGIARGMEGDQIGLTEAGMTVGTPEYMAPEQVRGDPVDARSDLYSFGVVLYEMFTGELPFSGRSKTAVKRQQLEKRPDPPRFYRPELPADLEAILLRALEKDPERRFASMSELGAELARVQAAHPGQAGDAGARGPAAGERQARTPQSRAPEVRLREAVTLVSPAVGVRPKTPFSALDRLRDRYQGMGRRTKLLLAGAGALLALVLLASVLQGGGEAPRFTAEAGVDPRTGGEYGAVLAHGVPVMVITRPLGESSPGARAAKTAGRLQELLAGRTGAAGLDPERLVALTTARGETVLAGGGLAVRGEVDPDEILVTVDEATAREYAGTDRAALARWWRDLLRDHLRLARGRPPISTHGTLYGRILDQVYATLEHRRQGGRVAPELIRTSLGSLPEPDRAYVKTAWRAVERRDGAGGETRVAPGAGLIPLTAQRVTASDAAPGYPAAHALDGNAGTAWVTRPAARSRRSVPWLLVNLPVGSSLGEILIQEGRWRRPWQQRFIKQARVMFSDGTVRRVRRRKPGEPLRLTTEPRAASWLKVTVEQTFNTRRSSGAPVVVSELRLWGQ